MLGATALGALAYGMYRRRRVEKISKARRMKGRPVSVYIAGKERLAETAGPLIQGKFPLLRRYPKGRWIGALDTETWVRRPVDFDLAAEILQGKRSVKDAYLTTVLRASRRGAKVPRSLGRVMGL